MKLFVLLFASLLFIQSNARQRQRRNEGGRRFREARDNSCEEGCYFDRSEGACMNEEDGEMCGENRRALEKRPEDWEEMSPEEKWDFCMEECAGQDEVAQEECAAECIDERRALQAGQGCQEGDDCSGESAGSGETGEGGDGSDAQGEGQTGSEDAPKKKEEEGKRRRKL